MRVITPGLMQRVEALLSRLLLLVCLRMEVGAGWHLGPGLGIAESRLTSQPKAARHEWAPTTTTRLPHSDAYRALYPTTHSHSLHISQNQISSMRVAQWPQLHVFAQI